MKHSFVCISHTTGAGAEEVAGLVAERLDFRLLDEDILLQAADRAGVEPEEMADVEQRKSFLARVADGMIERGVASAYGPMIPQPSGPKRAELRDHIRRAIEESTADGPAVIVAHGASIALMGRDDVLRVLVTASPETRAGRLERDAELERSEAAKLVKESDAARAAYLKDFYDVDRELPTSYDLVLNTDRLTAEEAADLVVHALKL
jgi:cytidylate kinase